MAFGIGFYNFAFDNSIIGISKYGIQISKLTVYMCFLGLVCKRYHIKKMPSQYNMAFFQVFYKMFLECWGLSPLKLYPILWYRELGDTFKMESGCVLVEKALFVRFGTLSLWSKLPHG